MNTNQILESLQKAGVKLVDKFEGSSAWEATDTKIVLTIDGNDIFTKQVTTKDGREWAFVTVMGDNEQAVITIGEKTKGEGITLKAKKYKVIRLECIEDRGNATVGDVIFRAIPV